MNRVTVTGVDTTSVYNLESLSQSFPFCEWGVLIRPKGVKHDRFLSNENQKKLIDNLERSYSDKKHIQMSCHICGEYVNDILMGKDPFGDARPPILQICQRAQINTHGAMYPINESGFVEQLKKLEVEQVIIQFDDVNNKLLDIAISGGIDAVPLFDLSHGAGVLPLSWPDPVGDYCGYAGGLSPENVADQIKLIKEAAKGKEFWIDAETKLRTDNKLDYGLVTQYLERSEFYVD